MIAERLGMTQPAISYQVARERTDGARPSDLVAAGATVLREVAEQHGFSRLAVFGSAARGDDRLESDLDLLVQPPNGADLFDMVNSKKCLNEFWAEKSISLAIAASTRSSTKTFCATRSCCGDQGRERTTAYPALASIAATTTSRGKDAYNFDEVAQEAGDSLMIKLDEASKTLATRGVRAPAGVNWSDAAKSREKLAHHYSVIDRDVTWHTLSVAMPARERVLAPLFAEATATVELGGQPSET